MRNRRDSAYTSVYWRSLEGTATAMMGLDGHKHRVLAVLGGSSLPGSLLRRWAVSATFVAAADGGADALLAVGITPDLVVGDLDSLRSDRALLPCVREDPSPESTDCDKLLAALRALGYGEATFANVHGGLPDHELAALHSIAKGRIESRLIYERGFGYLLAGPAGATVEASGRVSLLPLTACDGVTLTGVRWPLDGVHLDPLGATSISNAAVEPRVGAALASGAAFLFVERAVEPEWPA